MEWKKTDMVRRKSTPTIEQQRRLRFELLERRHMLAATNLGGIGGTVFDDLTGNGYTASDPGLANVQVQLYLSNSGTTFNASTDTLLQSMPTNSSGQYQFTGLAAGTYFVRQVAPAGYHQLPGADVALVTITTAQAAGLQGTVIDTFNQTQQSVNASIFQNHTLDTSLVAAPEAIGGFRGLYAQLTSNTGNIGLSVDENTPDQLEYTSGSASSGTRTVTWDGTPGNGPSLVPTGLRNGGPTGVDLTGNNASTALQLSIGADQNGGAVTLLVYTDANNASTVTVAVPNTTTGAATATVIIPFSSFTTLLGTGANFKNVGALQLQLTGVDAVDGDISLITAIGPNVQTVNMQNFNQLSLGNLVWNDANINGLYDSATEPGLANVKLNLYSVPSAGSTFSPSDTFVSTTTTGADGKYLFTNLFPGNYIVQIDPSNFVGAGAILGNKATTGLAPVPNANNGIDGQNKGSDIPGQGVASSAITLAGNGAPLVGGNTDPNSYVTLDFGLIGTTDLAVNKTGAPNPVLAGNLLTYTIIATNNGPNAATGVKVVDTLPSNVTFVSSSAGTFNAGTGTLTDTIGNLAVGASQQFTVVVAVGAGFTGSVTNTAVVSGNQPDPIPENNTSTVTTTVNAQTDLAIVKTATPSPVGAGQTISYTLMATNNGPSNATGVNIADVLLNGLTFVSATAGTYNAALGTFTYMVGNLAAGASQSVTITATVGASVIGSISNTATVAGNEPDPNLANNTSTVVTPVNSQADLSIVKTASPNPVVGGKNLTYTLMVTNNGPGTATGVTITDPLPAGETFVSATTGSFNSATNTLTDAIGTLAVGASQSVTVTVTVAAAAAGTLSNTATVTGNQPDPNPGNNTSTVITTVNPQADVSITKVASANPVSPGGDLVYTLVVTNNGPSTATNVKVTDPLPSSVSFDSDTNNGNYDFDSNTDTFSLGTLAPGQSVTITIDTTVNFAAPVGLMTNTATVSSSTPDLNPGNNVATATTTVNEIFSSVSGYVYVDPNKNGVFEAGEKALGGVTVFLTGTDRRGNSVSLSTLTNAAGLYSFSNLVSGNYNVANSPVAGYKAGKITTGFGASANAVDGAFSNMALEAGIAATHFDFAEDPAAVVFSKRQFLAFL